MRTRDFRMGFFGRREFDSDARNNFMEKWSAMTTEEKIDFMDEKMEAINSNSVFGPWAFFKHGDFGADIRQHIHDKWAKMSAEEKEAFIKEKEDAMRNGGHLRKGFFDDKEFSVETIDNLCEKWMKKSPEEKEEFIKSRKEMMHHHRDFCMHGFKGRRHGSFHFDAGDEF